MSESDRRVAEAGRAAGEQNRKKAEGHREDAEDRREDAEGECTIDAAQQAASEQGRVIADELRHVDDIRDEMRQQQAAMQEMTEDLRVTKEDLQEIINEARHLLQALSATIERVQQDRDTKKN